MDIRSRSLSKKTFNTVNTLSRQSNIVKRYSLDLFGHQRTESEGHPISRLRKSGEDIGGNFKTERWYYPAPSETLHLSNGDRAFDGPVWATRPDPFYTVENPTPQQYSAYSVARTVDNMVSYGTTAIARTVPTNPTFSAAAALGELREGLPSLPGKTVLKNGVTPKSVSGEYLNLEFGIKPMLSDAQKLIEAHSKASKTLDQLYRDSGRLVRRKCSFPPEEVVTETYESGVYPWSPGINAYTFGTGTLTHQIKTTTEYWFSGAYTYLFPRQEGWHRTIAELEKVYGVIPDVSDLYQLTPWSWAVDWVSNTGDLVSNLNSFAHDNLVLRYGYIMCKTTREYTDTWNGSTYVGGKTTPTVLTSSWRTVCKQRQKATPYGFGLKESAFSPRQWAILSALGISRFGRR